MGIVQIGWICKQRSERVNPDNLDVWILFLEPLAHTGDGAARPRANHGHVQPLSACRNDFLCRAVIMCEWIVGIGILVKDDGSGRLGVQTSRET